LSESDRKELFSTYGSASLGYDTSEDHYVMSRHSAYAYGLIGGEASLGESRA